MKKKNRPLAPHLTIYTPQITSIVSIFHRISGSTLALSVISVILLVYADIAFSEFYSFYYNNLMFQIYFYWIFLILSNFTFVLICFHFCNGIRHIVWDFGIGLDNKNIAITGFIVLGFSSICLLLIIL
jgi:succinate dehydrogenase / fumarate reductase cytochrome b subunit